MKQRKGIKREKRPKPKKTTHRRGETHKKNTKTQKQKRRQQKNKDKDKKNNEEEDCLRCGLTDRR
jgi:hypothetical protein